MKDCFKRFLLPSLALLVFASAFFGSCVDVDNQLGLGLLPDDQEMVFSEAVIGGIGTYMAFSDSLPVNQPNLMVLGNYTAEGFGHVRSGAAVQFVPSYFSTGTDFYGYKPHADSLFLYMSVSKYYGDTTKTQKFYVYPIEKTLPWIYEPVYGEFPAEEYADMSKPLFSFNMKGHGAGTFVKKLEPEPAGEDYLQSLVNYGIEDEYEIYNNKYLDSLYRKDFLGLYIAPSPDPSEAAPDGAIYLLSPISVYSNYSIVDNTYLRLYYHSYYESDDDIPEDTEPDEDETGKIKPIAYSQFSFDDNLISLPNVNIIAVERDYSMADFDVSDFVDPETFVSGTIPSEGKIYIQGLMGVAGYLDFGDEFLSNLKKLAFYEGEERILNINRARLFMWLDDDSNEKMDIAPTRLGMYYDYKGILPVNIPDYYYYYEQQNTTESGYGGYINRALGYYEMDITMYLRDLLTNEDAEKQVWLGPGHTNDVFYSPSGVVIQNPEWNGVGEPPKTRMQLKLTYTLLKKTINDK